MKMVFAMFMFWAALGASAQQPISGSRSCTVTPAHEPTDADEALAHGRFDEAEKEFAAMPPSDARTVGLVRAMLGERKLKEALTLAQSEVAAHPDDAVLLDALGEVRFRRGESDEAATALTHAVGLDLCLAQAHFDVGLYLNLSGRYASAMAELDKAHRLAPDDPAIQAAYRQAHATRATPEERLASLEERAKRDDLTDEQKAGIEASIKYAQSRQKGDCQLTEPVATTKVGLLPLGNPASAGGSPGVGMDATLNGKRKRLQLDTGASGLSITREAAKSLGLTPEFESLSGGLGDSGSRTAFVTHIDSIRLGNMEFHNCRATVFESKNVLQGQDGLIGADVFSNFLVTIDFPSDKLVLSPLPRRPDDTGVTATLATGDETRHGMAFEAERKDRYIAPEMKDWTSIFRTGHMLIVPAFVGKAPSKLFLVDSGSAVNLISPDTAREVTQVGADDSVTLRGISGKVANVMSTGSMYIQFARVRQQTDGMLSIDTSGLSRYAGVELSGIIGFPILKQLVIQLDYRDNLMHVSYTPHISIN